MCFRICVCVFMFYVIHVVCLCFFFFFKQKTAYEMRISDWSSDVCSSDLYCDAPKPSFEKAPEGKAPPKISGCRANGADITRTNAPQHQGSSRLPAVTRAVIGATREVRPRGGIEFQARLVKLRSEEHTSEYSH